MTAHEIDLRREYEYETGIEFITVTGANTKKYVRWLENRLLSSSHNSDYAKCVNELMAYSDIPEDRAMEILKSHFA